MPRVPPESSSEVVRVIGIDPGTLVAGWAVVEARGSAYQAIAYGALRALAKESKPQRLATIAAQLREVIATHAPTEAALEEAFHGRDARAALAIGEARGAFMAVLGERQLVPASYANNVVKKAVTGAGRAAKSQVQAAVRRILRLSELPTPLDASDALAVAICHLQRRGMPTAGGGGLSPRVAEALRKQGIDPGRARGRRS